MRYPDSEFPVREVPGKTKGRRGRRLLRFCAFGCGGFLLFCVALVALGFLLLGKVPKTYPGVAEPISPPAPDRNQGELDGFDSPYLGHTGSWDGKGGGMFGATKVPDLDRERAMGLRWTFMAVYWRAMEPEGPVDLDRGTPVEWRELDSFVIEAQRRGLNILMQAPVVGGNAGGPPDWAGRREPGKSAPANMEALASFARKLVARYCPNGTLARQQNWGSRYGVRAWELDNEPESYRTHWKGQGADYAEFVTKAAAAIKQADSRALILSPAMAGGPSHQDWLEAALDPGKGAGSPAYRRAGKAYSIGPVTDVVSFHCYEGLETAFSGSDRTIERDFSDIRALFEKCENRTSGFHYARKQDYWHTEGNYDFFGVLSAERRAAWRFQFFTRAFAAGIRKVVVMDASPAEQVAVRAYVQALPDPFPMLPATREVAVHRGQVVAFKHPVRARSDHAVVWVLWAVANTGDASVEIPVSSSSVSVIGVDGWTNKMTAPSGTVRLQLNGETKMAPGVLLLDFPQRPN